MKIGRHGPVQMSLDLISQQVPLKLTTLSPTCVQREGMSGSGLWHKGCWGGDPCSLLSNAIATNSTAGVVGRGSVISILSLFKNVHVSSLRYGIQQSGTQRNTVQRRLPGIGGEENGNKLLAGSSVLEIQCKVKSL